VPWLYLRRRLYAPAFICAGVFLRRRRGKEKTSFKCWLLPKALDAKSGNRIRPPNPTAKNVGFSPKMSDFPRYRHERWDRR
jgi:hypothetical protein